jgi:hypothetical protein
MIRSYTIIIQTLKKKNPLYCINKQYLILLSYIKIQSQIKLLINISYNDLFGFNSIGTSIF